MITQQKLIVGETLDDFIQYFKFVKPNSQRNISTYTEIDQKLSIKNQLNKIFEENKYFAKIFYLQRQIKDINNILLRCKGTNIFIRKNGGIQSE